MGRVRKGRDIDAALRKKGFRRDADRDHVYYFLTDSDGNDVGVKTKISHGMMGETIGDPLIGKMARQLHFSKSQFLAFIDCTLDEAGYREILARQGLVM